MGRNLVSLVMAIVGVVACLMISKELVAVLGAALAVIGGIVLILDLRGQSSFAKSIEAEIHIAGLKKGAEDLEAIPKTGGAKTPEGIDIDTATKIMKDGVEGAITRSEQTRIELLESVLEHQEKHRGAERLAIELVVIGGAISLYATVLST